MKRTIFIVGTDTSVGKTVLTTMLIRYLRQDNQCVNALKPFCSGTRDDVVHLADALENLADLDSINPFFFSRPVTPLVAARMAGCGVTVLQCLKAIRLAARMCDVLLVEGAGGLLSPLGEDFDTLSLIQRTRAETILVAPDRLGVMNQVFLNLRLLERANRLPTSVVLMGQKTVDASVETNAKLIREKWPELSVLKVPYLGLNPLANRARKESYKKIKKTLAAVMGRP